MICKTIVEGTTKVLVPIPPIYATFPPSAAPVFYNPEMELNRDINVAATAAFVDRLLSKKKSRRENIKLNCLEEKSLAIHKYANLLLHEKISHIVDIDPFGTPSPFLDAAST